MSVPGFSFDGLRSRVVFGDGTLGRIAAEMERLGRSRAFLLSTPGHRGLSDRVAEALGPLAVGRFAGAEMHTPVAVTEAALGDWEAARADCLVALGGGSTIGLGKAIAVRTGADQIAVPTTYAGSEMTDILGETAEGKKTTRRDPGILPEVVIYDVALTLGLPPAMTATSGMNALAHAVEALYAPDRNPVLTLMAGEAVRALGAALPMLAAKPGDRGARELALYAAWLAGAALGGTTMGLHHKLCHVLGGSFGLPHSATHAVILPHAAAYNAAAAGALLAPVAGLGAGGPGAALFGLARRIGAPLALRDLGMAEADLDRAAGLAVERPYANPRPVARDAVRALLGRAWAGEPPAA